MAHRARYTLGAGCKGHDLRRCAHAFAANVPNFNLYISIPKNLCLDRPPRVRIFHCMHREYRSSNRVMAYAPETDHEWRLFFQVCKFTPLFRRLKRSAKERPPETGPAVPHSRRAISQLVQQGTPLRAGCQLWGRIIDMDPSSTSTARALGPLKQIPPPFP